MLDEGLGLRLVPLERVLWSQTCSSPVQALLPP
jgi:hypothetical protein